MNTPKAIYHVVPLSRADQQDTLIYNTQGGFAWVSLASGQSSWSTENPTAVGAELEARTAGLDPQAIAYINPKSAS